MARKASLRSNSSWSRSEMRNGQGVSEDMVGRAAVDLGRQKKKKSKYAN